jgi:hypothetical protein
MDPTDEDLQQVIARYVMESKKKKKHTIFTATCRFQQELINLAVLSLPITFRKLQRHSITHHH